MTRAAVLFAALLLSPTLLAEEAAAPAPTDLAVLMQARSLRCFELGTLWGMRFQALNASQRKSGPILENYCRGRKDRTLRRIPNDQDVARIAQLLQGAGQGMESRAKIMTGPLDEQMQEGNQAEQDMLDHLLQ